MATVVRGKLLRADQANWDGVTKTASRIDATGGTLTGLTIGEEVDVLLVYGGGSSRTRASIDAALSNIGTSRNVSLMFSVGTWTIDADLTIPANFVSRIPAGCVFSVASGVTLTFSGDVIVEQPSTWTTGSGTVVVSKEGIQGAFFARTSAERSASVTPVDYRYPELHPYRYAPNTTPGTTSMAPALSALTSVAAQKSVMPTIYLPEEVIYAGDDTQWAITASMRIVGGHLKFDADYEPGGTPPEG